MTKPLLLATTLATLAIAGSALAACSDDHRAEGAAATTSVPRGDAAKAAAPAQLNPRLLRRFKVVNVTGFDAPADEDLISLGSQLFHEPRLSIDSTVSCNSCHDLTHFGTDRQSTSTGVQQLKGSRNSPTVLNAAGAFTQFWDGRASTVEEQAIGPMLNPREMGMHSRTEIVERLEHIPGYVSRFATVFHDSAHPVTIERVGVAIGAFERRLATPGRWDKYLEGDENALSAKERDGLRTFLNSGCMVCHTGALLGGATFERVGVVEPWPNQADEGRMTITRNAADRMSFKVPSLRNVAETAPYFHDGSAATLEEAVKLMGRHQLGLELGSDEVDSIATWLRSLTSPLPSALTANPTLPL